MQKGPEMAENVTGFIGLAQTKGFEKLIDHFDKELIDNIRCKLILVMAGFGMPEKIEKMNDEDLLRFVDHLIFRGAAVYRKEVVSQKIGFPFPLEE
jgi:hypothetical protein